MEELDLDKYRCAQCSGRGGVSALNSFEAYSWQICAECAGSGKNTTEILLDILKSNLRIERLLNKV